MSLLEDHITYCKDCIYDAYTELNVTNENTFNLLKSEAINEAIDDIRTEPYLWGDYDLDMVMNLTVNDITFNEYMEYRNTWGN